jgi:hypothetical protein
MTRAKVEYQKPRCRTVAAETAGRTKKVHIMDVISFLDTTDFFSEYSIGSAFAPQTSVIPMTVLFSSRCSRKGLESASRCPKPRWQEGLGRTRRILQGKSFLHLGGTH